MSTLKNQKFKFTIDVKNDQKRLDVALSNYLSQYSRVFIASVIKQGLVMVDNSMVTSSKKRVKINQIIKVVLPSQSSSIKAEAIDLDIIYQDKDIAVINKPAGIVMHPAGKHKSGTLANALKYKFDNFYLVHRLDKNTSGVIIVAKNKKIKQFLSKLFETRKITKKYIALLQGRIKPKKAFIDLPIRRGKSGKFEVQAGGRRAKSFWQLKKYIKKMSLVEILLETGRTHQIRVHFKALGYPVVGDEMYGKAIKELNRQFLHAYSLEFIDWLGKKRYFKTPLSPELKQYLDYAEA